jgi:EAL domain-containing protein (putative c-di-GMP-specific phosphodiesterase class I)
MLSDEDSAAIVRSTIDLAHNLGLEVVAEGVASEQINAILAKSHATRRRASPSPGPIAAADVAAWAAEINFIRAAALRQRSV